MRDLFVPQVGAVFSADIAVPEHERVARFYAHVLSTGEHALWRADDLMNNLGLPIIGVGARTPDYAQLPLQWMPHIQVADIATSVQHALRLGGETLLHAQDEAGASQWAVLSDPHGTAFGLIPVVAETPKLPADTPVGRIAWLYLAVAEADAAREFYRQVIGWRVQDERMYGVEGTPVAQISQLRDGHPALPAVWLLALPVGDLAESLRRVEASGGQVVTELPGADGAPRSVAIQDPAGAYVALLQA